MPGEIQYVTDTILLEETFQVLSELNQSGIEKYAFDLASILPSIGSWVSSHTGEQFRNEPNSILRTISDFVVPGIAFGIHPLLGALVSVAEYYGYDLASIYDKIKNAILPDIEAGKPIDPAKINTVAQSAIPNLPDEPPGPPEEENAADDLLYPLRAMRNNGGLTKEAVGAGYIAKNRAEGGWLNPLKGLLNLFSARRRGSIIVGLLVWFLKTVLLSAGLLAVSGAVLPKNNPITGQAPQTPIGTANVNKVDKPVSTGAGEYLYKTQPNDLWIEDLAGRQPHDMILQWALQSYPILSQYRSIILNTPSFWNAVRKTTEKWKPGEVDISIPDPFNKRDDVVNLFIDDVFKAISEGRK